MATPFQYMGNGYNNGVTRGSGTSDGLNLPELGIDHEHARPGNSSVFQGTAEKLEDLTQLFFSTPERLPKGKRGYIKRAIAGGSYEIIPLGMAGKPQYLFKYDGSVYGRSSRMGGAYPPHYTMVLGPGSVDVPIQGTNWTPDRRYAPKEVSSDFNANPAYWIRRATPGMTMPEHDGPLDGVKKTYDDVKAWANEHNPFKGKGEDANPFATEPEFTHAGDSPLKPSRGKNARGRKTKEAPLEEGDEPLSSSLPIPRYGKSADDLDRIRGLTSGLQGPLQ